VACGESKLLRLEAMLSAMLDEVRLLDAGGPTPVAAAEATRRACAEVGSAVSDEELEELGSLVGSLAELDSAGTLRVVDAQLVGWLRGRALQAEWSAMQAVVGAATEAIRARKREQELEARHAARRVL
jgi:hypothetical protein